MPVAISILNGHSDLFVAAELEYLEKEERGIRIVVFGHTHEPMIDVYPPGESHTSIYANVGSWVNEASAGYRGAAPIRLGPLWSIYRPRGRAQTWM